MPNNEIIMVFLPKVSDAFIVHECVHAAFALNDLLGIHDEENICYFTEYLFNQIKNYV